MVVFLSSLKHSIILSSQFNLWRMSIFSNLCLQTIFVTTFEYVSNKFSRRAIYGYTLARSHFPVASESQRGSTILQLPVSVDGSELKWINSKTGFMHFLLLQPHGLWSRELGMTGQQNQFIHLITLYLSVCDDIDSVPLT